MTHDIPNIRTDDPPLIRALERQTEAIQRLVLVVTVVCGVLVTLGVAMTIVLTVWG
jgi:hypothetical protein